MVNNLELQDPLVETSTTELRDTGSQIKKRKRSDKSDNKSLRLPKKHRAAEDDHLDLQHGINTSFANLDAQLLADHIGRGLRRLEGDLSSIELEDRYISADCIRDTTSFDKPRVLDNLPAFLESFSPNPTKLWSASKKNGTPHTIIVAGAGLRAADLARVIRKFQTKDITVAKLFAKHIKLADAVKFLQSNRTGIAVGTPMRLNDLLINGALAVDRLERIVIDASHIDQKKRGILDMRETLAPLLSWLNRSEFKDRYAASSAGVDLMFF